MPRTKAEIEQTEKALRIRRSARTVASFQMHTTERSLAPRKPPTITEQVQQQLEHGRSGKAKKANFEAYQRRKRKEGEQRAVASLKLTDETLDEFRRAFARFDRDDDGTIKRGR
jgi:hypothetical protein